MSRVNFNSRLTKLEQRGYILHAEDRDLLKDLNAGTLIPSQELTDVNHYPFNSYNGAYFSVPSKEWLLEITTIT